MGNFNWQKKWVIDKKYNETIGKDIPETSGIYLWWRTDKKINIVKEFLENREFDTLLLNSCLKDFQQTDWNEELTTWYVGQAKNLRKRRMDYYEIKCGVKWPTRWFESSLKAHDDWQFKIIEQCPENELDIREFMWIWTYMSKPNHVTRNESLIKKDVVKSNTKRINKVIERYEREISEHLGRLSTVFGNDEIKFVVKRNKDGSLNKLSLNSFNEITNKLHKILEVENENQEK